MGVLWRVGSGVFCGGLAVGCLVEGWQWGGCSCEGLEGSCGGLAVGSLWRVGSGVFCRGLVVGCPVEGWQWDVPWTVGSGVSCRGHPILQRVISRVD